MSYYTSYYICYYSDLQSNSEQRRRKKKWKKFKERNALNNTKEIITAVSGNKVPSSVTQLFTISQSENVPLVESDMTTPKNNERSSITCKVDNICTSSGIIMTETPGIDNVLLKVKSSQKCKPMNIANKMDK